MQIVENDYAWSTHQPLLNALLDVFKPKTVLELGTGLFSTPIFISRNLNKLVCIENDEGWFNRMNGEFGNKCDMKLHKLENDLNVRTFLRQLTSNQKETIVRYYEALAKSIQDDNLNPKLLFVDNFACCRSLAINTLHKDFDIVVYHDCEPAGITFYEYHFVENLKIEFNSYVLKTPKSWTGCFIRRTLSQDALKSSITLFVSQYCIENGLDTNQVYLEKQY